MVVGGGRLGVAGAGVFFERTGGGCTVGEEGGIMEDGEEEEEEEEEEEATPLPLDFLDLALGLGIG